MTLREQAQCIIDASLREALPGAAVRQALKKIQLTSEGRVVLVAAGKAAFEMARAAHEALGDKIAEGVVITKYGHVRVTCRG